MHRLIQTSIFRIALLYLLLLGATLAVLLGFIYWSTAGLIERQTDETVQAEIRGLAEQYRDEGLVRLTVDSPDLKKARLPRMDADWVKKWRSKLEK